MRVEIRVVSGPAKGKLFTFDKPDRFLFGRTVDARISLPNDPYVSRQHFLLEISPPACKVTELNSKNGLFVNGVRYGGRKPAGKGIKQAPNGIREVQLKDGDEIVVGETCMKVTITPPGNEKQKEVDITFSQQPTTPFRKKEDTKRPDSSDHVAVLDKLLQDAVAKKSRDGVPEIDGYQISEMINRGGMGMVYKAVDNTTGRTVAIKVMLPQAAADPENVSNFQREIEVTRQLNHPNVVQLFDHGKAQETFYFVLEFVDGMDLAQFLESKGGSLALDEAAPIMLGMLNGLAYAHHAKVSMQIAEGKADTFTGIVHRDLKPHNILLERLEEDRWFPKVTDFGIAKSFESAGLTNITKPGDVLGTPMYWPREQITHYKYLNPSTDVFSVAAVIYEMLTGAWVRDGFQELFDKCRERRRMPAISDYMEVIIGHPAVPIRQKNPEIPEPIATVIDQALREEEVPYDRVEMQNALAKLRYPDAQAFQMALVGAFEEARLLELLSQTTNFERKPAKDQKSKQAEQVKSVPQDLKDLAAPTEGSIFYSIMRPSSTREVALFVLDLEHSSEYIRDFGDTHFSNLIGTIYRRVKTHRSSSDLIFMKTTGDGFLAVFHTLSAAFSVALTFLDTDVAQDIQVRMALHWGSVKTGPDGDVLGVEVHRVFRIEGVQDNDRVESMEPGIPFSGAERILITREALEQLDETDRSKFQSAGKFQLKGFSEPCELWILHK